MHSDDVNNPVAYYTFIKSVNNKPKGLASTSVACCPACLPLSASIAFLSLRSRLPGSAVLSSLPPEERGGPREGNLQISSINHKPESNVTNILQLEETRWSWGPSISLTPHDHRFIRAEERERGRPQQHQPRIEHTHTLAQFAGHTPTHMQTLTHPHT